MKRILCVFLVIISCINVVFFDVYADDIATPMIYGSGYLLKSDGTVWYLSNSKYSLKKVDNIDNVTSLFAEYASKKDGTLYKLEYDYPTNKYSAYQIEGISDVKDIIDLYYYKIAVKNDGTVWWWGERKVYTSLITDHNPDENTMKTITSDKPQKIEGIEDAVELLIYPAGYIDVAVIKKDGTMWSINGFHYDENGYGVISESPAKIYPNYKLKDFKTSHGLDALVCVKYIDNTGNLHEYHVVDDKGQYYHVSDSIYEDLSEHKIKKAVSFGKKFDDERYYFKILLSDNGEVYNFNDSNMEGVKHEHEELEKPIMTDVIDISENNYHGGFIAIKRDGTLWHSEVTDPNGSYTTPTQIEDINVYESDSVTPAAQEKSSSASQISQSGISVILNGDTLSFTQPPVIENGTTLVPMRTIFEALGAEVNWDNNTKTVTAVKDSTTINLTINAVNAYVNEKTISLSVPAKIINGNTMVPLRFVGESLGATVKWDGETKTITIN